MDIVLDYIPPTPQELFHAAPQPYKLFGGAVGGGKSYCLCYEVLLLSLEYPGNRIMMCRYHLADFKNSTLKTLLKIIPHPIIKSHNQQDHVISLLNGSEIMYMGLSEENAKQKIGSIELGAFGIDEAQEITKDSFLFLKSRIRRWKLPTGKFPPKFGLLTCNPADCWLKDYFVLGGGGDEAIYIPSKTKDNPHLHPEYEKDLRKSYPEDWVKRFLDGSWDDLASGDEIIKSDWVYAAVNREIDIQDKRVIACDVARYGNDEIVTYYGKGNAMVSQHTATHKSTVETSGMLMSLANKNKAHMVVIDDAGVGGGVTDQLKDAGFKVVPINGGSESTDDRYQNLKTQMWYHARDMFEQGRVSILNDPKLIRQLSAIKYVYRSNGKIMAEKKADTKGRLGYSPDRAEALVLMLWGASKLRDPARDFMRRGKNEEIETQSNPYGWSYHDDQQSIELSELASMAHN
jgi:PBSX family phage terminase large subunit